MALILALTAAVTVPSHAAVTFTINAVIDATNLTYDGQDIVIQGCTVTANGHHSFNSLTLNTGAVLTHQATTATQEYSLGLTIANSLAIDASSRIDVSGRGFVAGYTLGNTTNNAATFTAGGSYGGLGGICCNSTGNPVYGDFKNPNELGSGSGTYSGGASGGGLVRLSAASAQIDGEILANGGDGYDGGSGGAIYLSVGSMTGSGRVSANGGNANGNDGGGGGRVAIYYGAGTFNFSTNVTAHAGTGPSQPGSLGTVYLQPTGGLGQLVLNSHNTPVAQWTPIGAVTDTVFTVDSLIVSGSNVVVAPLHQMGMDVGTVTILNAGIVTHQPTTSAEEYSLILTVASNLVVDAASAIDVSARGYLPGYTLGNTTTNAAQHTAGGSYAGLGGLCCGSTGNPVYGDFRNPAELGSGSGTYSGGAPGGGLTRIHAGTAQIDGAILANGGNAYDGGSGGAIYIVAATLNGSGRMNANGGNANGNDGGGGGRVAIYYGSGTFNLSGNVTANAGTGPTQAGSVGTVYLQPTGGLGQLVVDSHGTPAAQWTPLGASTDSVFQVDSLLVKGTNVVVAPEHQMAMDVTNVTISNAGLLTHQPTTSSLEYSLLVNVTSNLVVDAGSSIDASARGYLPGHTLGNTTSDAAQNTAGGSYGGLGGLCCNSTGNAVYGDFRNPNELGSGSGTYNGGAAGGGLLRITAGSATIDGVISVNGGDAYDGGSGGGVLLQVGNLSGSGHINSNGGNASGNDGGGGGRVAIYYAASSFDLSNNVTADPGRGPSQAGSVGTVYLQSTGGSGRLVIDSHGSPTAQWTPLGVSTDTVFQVDSLLISGTNVIVAPEHQMQINLGAASILNAASLTHLPTTPSNEYSLLLMITNNLSVDSGSTIDVSARGYLAGFTLGNTAIGAAQNTAGGSYGGLGGLCCNSTGNQVYGDYHNPNELGSGSGTYSGGAPGGGLVRIVANSVKLDGGILANGGAGYDGGSGGGILLSVGSLSGGGRVLANGGTASGNDGGGGGRVAIYYNSSSFNLSNAVSAFAGHGPTQAGSPGSVYLQQGNNVGQLVISSGTTSVGQWTPLGGTNDSVFAAGNLVVSGQGTIAATLSGAPIQAESLSIVNGAMLTHLATTPAHEYSLELTVSNQLVVDVSSSINVSAMGYQPGYTFGDTTLGAATHTAGGSYGGLGGICCGSTGNPVYGDYRNPNELGSGSGTYSGGAAGGGLMRITAASAQVDGSVQANGGNSYDGGSGGGIYLNVGTLNGSGQITANGGAGNGNDGGGGGRVAIYYSSGGFNFSSNVTANAGNGPTQPGSAGTVYIQQSGALGQLIISSHGTPVAQWTPLGAGTDTVFTVGTLLVNGTNVVVAPEHQMPISVQNVSVLNGALLTHQPTAVSREYSLLLDVTSNLVVDGSSSIDVSARGYLAGYTLGNTIGAASTRLGGGSYGGLGGNCCNDKVNPVYGDYHDPNQLGSGSGGYGGGAPGGGLVQISAAVAQVDGAILADGGNGYDGGSGGGILLNVGVLKGSGLVAAKGGNGAGNNGGGGGRVAVYTWHSSSFASTNVSTAGGKGPSTAGQDGSTYFASQPFLTFSQTPQFWHGVQQITWSAIGVDPNGGDTAEVTVSGEGVTYLDEIAPATAGLQFNTANLKDGSYTLNVTLLSPSGQVLGQIAQRELVNNSVTWHEGALTTNETWASGTVHVVDQTVVVGTGITLTIAPGAIVKFVKGSGITVDAGGTLNALGTSAQPIVLTSLADDSAGGDSNLDGTSSGPQPGAWSGVAVLGGQFNANAYTDIRYSQNTVGGILASSQSWIGNSVYVVSNTVVVPAGLTLTINPGAVVKFIAGAGLNVQAGGTLNSLGTVAQPITFTSFADDTVGGDSNNDGASSSPAAGDWVGFNISGAAFLSHAYIRYGGNTGSGAFASGIIIVNTGSLTLSNSVVESALYDGLSIYGNGGTGLVLNTILRNLDRAIWAWGGGAVRLVNCTFDQNVIGLDNHGGGTVDVENCVIANSIQASDIEGPVTVRYSDIWSSYTNSANPIPVGQNGNISADPRFVDPAQGDYRLNYLSPCIDAADGAQAPATDFQNDPRYNDPRTVAKNGVANAAGNYPDMGAFEFVEVAPSAVDLIAESVTGPNFVQVGQTAVVQWIDSNRGSGNAAGPWHDTISLVSMTDTNSVVTAAEVLEGQAVVLGPGQSTTNTAVVSVPGRTAGKYLWQVQVNSHGDVFEGANWTNNTTLADTPTTLTVPVLNLDGLLATNSFITATSAVYFSFLPQPNQDVLLNLNLLNGTGALNLYVGQGYMPDPQHFDFHQTQWNASSVSTLVPSASSQPYFIMVVPSSLSSAPALFTISGTPLSFQLTGVSPTVVGNAGLSTLQIQGSQITSAMTFQVVEPGGTAHTAVSSTLINNSQVSATFDFTGLPVGNYGVRVAGTSATLPGAVRVVQGTPGKLSLQITEPRYQRLGRVSTLQLTYMNTGGSDIPAPVLFLQANNGQFRLPGQDVWSPGLFHVMAINQSGPAGVLPAGSSAQISLEFSQPVAIAGSSVFTVSAADPSAPIDWAGLYRVIQPRFQPDESWAVIYSNFVAKIGRTYGQLQSVLAQDATYLGLAGEQVMDVRRLLAFEFEQADNFGTITRRYRLGAFGRGLPDPTDVSALSDSSGNVVVRVFNNLRVFAPQPDGSYTSQPGDFGTLLKTSGVFHLIEKDGNITAFKGNGALDYYQDRNGNRTTATYTGNLVTAFTDASGNVTTLTYNGNGRITSVSDPVGRITTYNYDAAQQHVTSITNTQGSIALSWITGQGAAREHALSSITYPDGTHVFCQYDALGRMIKQNFDGGALPVSFSYDSFGAVTASNAAGVITRARPNEFFQVSQLTDRFGKTISASYDNSHNLTRLQDSSGAATAFTYDARGNLVGSTDPLGQQIGANYDPAYNLPVTIADPLGRRLEVQRDSKGNIIKQIYPDGTSDDYQYDAAGNVVSWTNRRGRAIRYSYDAHNLLAAKGLPDGTTQTFRYDAHRNLASFTDATGTTTYSYDAADRLTKSTDPIGRFLQFSYDAAGRRTKVTDQDGFAAVYAYDLLGRLASVSDAQGVQLASYSYDGAGRLAQRNAGTNSQTVYSYTSSGLVQSVINKSSGSVVSSRFDYAYDSYGRVTNIAALSGTSSYAYDPDGRLISVTLPGNRTISYRYDAAGNRVAAVDNGTNTSYSPNALNQYGAVGDAVYSYDAAGNLVSKQDSSGTTTYNYDDQNRLIQLSSPAGTWKYEYNALRQRTSVTFNGARTQYLIDPSGMGDVFGQYQAGALQAHFVWGLGLESRVDSGGNPGFYTFDGSGNTAGLLDASGNLLNTYSYLPFGEKLSQTGSTPNSFTFGARAGAMDGGEGIYFMRNRWYDPAVGHFTQPDPSGFAGGSLNLYEYVSNNPISGTDPAGLGFLSWLWGLVPGSATINLANQAVQTANTAVASGQAQQNTLNAIIDNPNGNWGNSAALNGGPIGSNIQPGLQATAGLTYSGAQYAIGAGFNATSGSPSPTSGLSIGGSAINGAITETAGGGTPNNPGGTSAGGNPSGGNPASGGGANSVSSGTAGPGGSGSGNGPGNPGGAPGATGQIVNVGSTDPNDKIGVGSGTQGFVTGDGALFYTVDFANQPSATAPAQQVVVTDRLDSNLDWSSFELQTIAFNNVNLTVPSGLQNYSNVVHVSTDPNPVQVTASFDPQTGLIRWQMQSIDPITQALVEDPFAGFLPPDNAQHAGEGSVTYVVRPKQALMTGAVVLNQADIVFDVNAPILTPTVTNTIDHTPPVSSIFALPPSTPTTNLVVSWSGSDVGSGIASFDIFVSINNGPWTVWLADTANTSGIFPAVFGSSYAFYSQATDAAGNVESSPQIPGTQTTVQLSQVPFLSIPAIVNGQVQFSVVAASGNRYVVQSSTNFNLWSPLVTNTAPFLFTDPSVKSSSSRWYRAVLAH